MLSMKISEMTALVWDLGIEVLSMKINYLISLKRVALES